MKDIMLDLETLGTRTTSAIIQIGACYFDRNTGDVGRMFFANTLHDDRFTIDDDTIRWWLNQSKEAQEIVSIPGQPIDLVVQDFADWLDPDAHIWCHATFDIPILSHAFEKCGQKFPVTYRKMRDIRTLMDLADYHPTIERTGIHHTALDDCIHQVKYCVEAIKKLSSSSTSATGGN